MEWRRTPRVPHFVAMTPAIPAALRARLNDLMASGRRQVLGLVGPPGCGKSTLAQALAATVPRRAVTLPMDGFHLANVELERLGRADRKGAPDTFDSAGYVALLRRLRRQAADEIVYAPAFRREIDEPVAGAIAVEPHCPLVITEGNYLLMEVGHWAQVRAHLDEAWFIDIDDELRRQRLVERHVHFGRTPSEARAWVASTDEPNARLVAATRHLADVRFRWE